MKLLLDTHIWIWSLLDPDRLAPRVARELEDDRNQLYVSAVSVWETLILAEKGRLALDPTPEEWVRSALREVPIEDVPLTREIAIRSRSLEVPNQDPADRFIAATAAVHEMTLVTADDLRKAPGLSVLANR